MASKYVTAYTALNNTYPPYFSVVRDTSTGVVTVYVRSPPDNGVEGNIVSIVIPPEDAQHVFSEAFKELC